MATCLSGLWHGQKNSIGQLESKTGTREASVTENENQEEKHD